MPDDEIFSISRYDDEEFGYSEKKLSIADEIAADNFNDELLSKANIEDTHIIVFVAYAQEALGVMRRFKESKSQKHLVASTVSRLVFDSLAHQLPNLLTSTIKNSLPQALTKSVKETLPGFIKRIRNVIKDEMTDILNTSVQKPMYKESNALNKLESQRLVSSVMNLMDATTPPNSDKGENDQLQLDNNTTDDIQTTTEVPAPA
ncbi:hypothetical protein Tco_0923153 [Tanacetum coccineum]|uniref:Uncharacterized protein n=1 Tax=Tanacetum coccineum TaxID=301880 RepID=A0ABQ5D160_9ASTR